MIKIEIKGVKNLQELERYIKNEKIKLVLFAETHGILDETSIQKEILKNLKFDLFIYELLEDKKLISNNDFEDFLLKDSEKDFSIISKYGELKPTIRLAKENNLAIIGCDLKNTGRTNTNFRVKEFSEEDLKEEEKLMEKREAVHYKTIFKYLNKNKRIFASIGLYHLLPKSYLMNQLYTAKFVIIYPEFKSGEKFGERTEFNKQEVHYKLNTGEEYLKYENKN